MGYKLAKGLQFIALLVVAQALVVGLVLEEGIALRRQYEFFFAGVLLFLVGYAWERWGTGPS